MGKHDTVDGWGIVDARGLDIRTVSDTRRAAIVNWLTIKGGQFISGAHSDDQIMALWDAHADGAIASRVRIAVVP